MTSPTPDRAASRRSLLRSAGIMTLMTLVSRVLGLVREQVRALYLGTGAASDAFGLAALIPNLLRRLVAEGAMTAAFLPVYVEYKETRSAEDTREFLSRFVTFLTFAVAVITVLGVLLTPWLIETFFASEFGKVEGKVELTIILTQLMWPYLFFVSIAAVLQALLNSHKIFGPSAFTPVLLNAAIIGCGIGFATVFPDASYALVTGFLVGGVLQITFQIPYLLRWTPVRFGLRWKFGPGVKRVATLMIPGVFSAGVYQVNVFISQLIASGLEGGSIASLQYSVRLQELVLGLFVVSVSQVILPTLSEQTAKEDEEGLKDTLAYATGLMAFVTLPATAGLILVGPEVIRLLFQFGEFDDQSTQMTAFALNFHAMGLFFIAATRVYQQAFYAKKDLMTPTLIAVVVTVTNIALCLWLSEPLGHGGIALAGSIAALVNGVLLIWVLRKRLGGLGLRAMTARVLRISLATGFMVGAVMGFRELWAPEGLGRLALAGWVLAVVVVAAAVFIAVCRVLGVDELADLWSAIRRRLGRRKKKG